jgi:hypothetical protein
MNVETQTFREGYWSFARQGRGRWVWMFHNEAADVFLCSERHFPNSYDCKEDAANYGYRPAWTRTLRNMLCWRFYQEPSKLWRWMCFFPEKTLGETLIRRGLKLQSPKRYETLEQCVLGAKLHGYTESVRPGHEIDE